MLHFKVSFPLRLVHDWLRIPIAINFKLFSQSPKCVTDVVEYIQRRLQGVLSLLEIDNHYPLALIPSTFAPVILVEHFVSIDSMLDNCIAVHANH